MPNPSDCLHGLLGLSQSGIACFPLPADAAFITASTTGLYLDTVEGLSFKPGLSQTPGADLYDRLRRARQQAIEVIYTNLATRAKSQAGKLRYSEAGTLGGPGNGQFATEGTAKLTLPTVYRPNGRYQLQSLQLLTDQTVSGVPVYLNGELLATVTTNAAPVALVDKYIPFSGEAYVLEAALPAGVRPRLNTLTCGCGNPFVNAVRAALVPGANVKAPAGGFVVSVAEQCTVDASPVCYALSQSDELARYVGIALMYKTAEHVVVGFMAEAGYNRYTSLEPKTLQALAELYHTKTDEYLSWLLSAEGIGSVANPCYQCAAPAWHPTMQRVN
ncbi:hypothetical protein F0P96_10555 [Hymenobacter busanensis]|uniref:Uncharacterized protein n=1 Tax=Hymenobacter busanensis TaxID=2607656 RepID=A0A7L4ZWP1_9BACT|nr:hypothetical protein [Hymenobacter busanensis]KAA9333401.1 hypothetical protein F0P96_10555 [Hymenobacter busanensis]QHJ07919.1 hypothetical protein GUY19_11750 [Hymenobacter busanensis]